MKPFCCFSQTMRNKTGIKGVFFSICLLLVVFCLSACQLGAGLGTSAGGKMGAGTEGNAPSDQSDLFVPDEGKLPPAAELEALSEADVFGTYTGSISVTMDGKDYGPYMETVKIGRKPSGDLFFISKRTSYEGKMPMDIGYRFEKTQDAPDSVFTLTPSVDGKSFSFTGKNAWMMYYFWKDTPASDPKKADTSNTSIKGYIYKKAGLVYISFTVQYDTEATRRAFPTIPEGTHRSMSSTMKKGAKK